MLETIDSPADLKRLSAEQLPDLAQEIREKIISVISKNAGHLASSLGAVELTLAIHCVFDAPKDRLIWDVGHQAYVHKLLTGRRDRFHTIRQYGGLSGYLRRDESEYDLFGAGHASTSISAALGMATARDMRGESHHVVSITGDGAMTGGMAFEAINNAGASLSDLIVVLNDNRMSISPNVGALSAHFTDIISTGIYNKFKDDVWDLMGRFKLVGTDVRGIISRVDQALKSLIVPGVWFEQLGFRYFGPYDGHDVHKLVEAFENIKPLKGPRLVHVYTVKGKGYAAAEDNPLKWHGVGGFDPETGDMPKSKGNIAYSDVFGMTLTRLAKNRPEVVALTAAMTSGTGLKYFAEEFPDRFFDVGIAEQHGVTFAGGLAAQGVHPVVAIYSTFLQRAFDQIIHDIALQRLPVVFALDRAGLVGDDGATHHGTFDLSYLRQIPGMVVMAPKDEAELQMMLATALDYWDGPIAFRFPRGTGPGVELIEGDDIPTLPIGSWEQLREDGDVAILAVGSMVEVATEVAQTLADEGIETELVNARFVKPMDFSMLDDLARRHTRWLTIEESVAAGGFGSGVLEYVSELGIKELEVHAMGLPDSFIEHGTRGQLLADVGLTADAVADAIRRWTKTGRWSRRLDKAAA